MADVENKALPVFRVDKSRWRKCYENATQYFGVTKFCLEIQTRSFGLVPRSRQLRTIGSYGVVCAHKRMSQRNEKTAVNIRNISLIEATEGYFNITISDEAKTMYKKCFNLITAPVHYNERISKAQKMFNNLLLKAEEQYCNLQSLRLLETTEIENNSIKKDVSEISLSPTIKGGLRKANDIAMNLEGEGWREEPLYDEENECENAGDEEAFSSHDQYTTPKQWICPALSSIRLERHLRVHIRREEPECGKHFPANTRRKAHIKYKRKPERFMCEECGVRITAKANLQFHMLTHTDNAPLECEF
uniref:C2H2-type domain-containing protein n=1 Tax=Glossina austeni TaxID=7395 RepID=A0A1A9VSV6_GLOAU